MASPRTLKSTCVPRRSVFDAGTRDTVHNIDDLSRIDAQRFFEENYVTDGMKLLLSEAFKRLEGQTDNASGAYLLSQSMGGGKTHNLLALGLLARNPGLRQQAMGAFHQVGSLGAVRTVTFSGRNTGSNLGIWGEIADQLGKRDVFKDFYSPLKPPGVAEWVELLRGEPVLIMLDELPPYFEAVRAQTVGATSLDVITTTALANLLVAIDSGELPRACLVLSDLRSSAYSTGSAAVNQALANLDQEATRSVTRIDPVRLASDELYQILRTRLFETVAAGEDVAAIADAYSSAVDEARKMDLTTASAPEFRGAVVRSYPFHPGIRDLYARFRENTGFQQTRALIRIMRLMVQEIWESGEADRRYLIGAHQLNLHRSDLMSEIRQINGTLENAIAHDIAAEGSDSVAETIDGPGRTDAQDAATIIFLSSLSTAVNPLLGLDRSTIVQYLVEPGRNISTLRGALDDLQRGAWYLHASSNGALFFRNTENLNAKLDSYTRGMLRDAREIELRDRLSSMFRPQSAACYQTVEALPALDQLQLDRDRTTLVIFRPASTALDEVKKFWEAQPYKNRLLFLTGSASGYDQVLERAATLRAIGQIINEFKQSQMPETDPQFKDAVQIRTQQESRFYIACREVFQQIYYPSRGGLTSIPIDLTYTGNRFDGEVQITKALETVFKYRPDTASDLNGYRARVEEILWPAELKEVEWSEIRRQAASNPRWEWNHPRALDDLRDEMVRQERWRQEGGYVNRGPFPKPQATVTALTQHRDPDTGEAQLSVRPVNADIVYWSSDGPATTNSERLDLAKPLRTRALRLSFLGVDSSGQHQTGEPVTWANTIEVKHRFQPSASGFRCQLEAVPGGDIRYTLDGSSPQTSGRNYDGPFDVPSGTRFVLAVASAEGISSDVRQWQVPEVGKDPEVPAIDPNKPAHLIRRQEFESTGAVYGLLETAGRHRGELGGITLRVVKEQQWVELTTDDRVFQQAGAIKELADAIARIVPGGRLEMTFEQVKCGSGHDLQHLMEALNIRPEAGEIGQ